MIVIAAHQPAASIRKRARRNMPEKYTWRHRRHLQPDLLKEFANAGGTLVFLERARRLMHAA